MLPAAPCQRTSADVLQPQDRIGYSREFKQYTATFRSVLTLHPNNVVVKFVRQQRFWQLSKEAFQNSSWNVYIIRLGKIDNGT